MLTNELVNKLKSVVGEENVITNDVDLVCYAKDLTPYFCKPDIVVFPKSTEEVSKIVKIAAEEKIPITPRGAGMSFTGSSLPRKGGILIDLSKMNRIIGIFPEDFQCTVEPGVTFRDLNDKLSIYGLFFPIDVGSRDSCTIGGMISSNSHGHHGLKYGSVKHWVLGLKVVLASGEIVSVGSKAQRSNCGYDLIGLFCGANGTLGIITEITLKVIPKPKYIVSIISFFDDTEDACKAVLDVLSSGVDASAIEIVDKFVLFPPDIKTCFPYFIKRLVQQY